MNKYSIKYSEEAKQDLLGIKRYIKYTLKEPIIAEKNIFKIKETIKKLKDNADIYRIIDDDFIKKLEIRKIMIDNYIIFYRIKDETVEIVRIMNQRRNWLNLL